MCSSPSSCERSGERDEAPLDTTVKNSETALLRGAAFERSRELQTPGFPGETEGPLLSDSKDLLSPSVLGKKSGLLFHAERGGTLGLAGFVAGEKLFSFCREVPGLCSKAARDVLVGLEESCGVCTI